MPVKLVIFDLDGTLVDSIVDITHALNYALQPHGFEPLTAGQTVRLVGVGISSLIESVTEGRERAVKSDVMERFLDHYTAHLLDNTREYPGVRETLELLVACRKVVISNKRESLSKKILDGLGLSKFFVMVVGSDTVQENKPSPAPILRVLDALHFQQKDAVIVGDSNYDIDAGKAAGIATIGVTYGYRSREDIAHADYLIDRMTDLPSVLERINKGQGAQ